jgi:tRNA A-37 threonylcarbamoyl transferase component Bud32
MPSPHLIARPPGSTPAELRSTRGHRRALPPDLLREASRRLGIMSLLSAVLWTVGPALGHVAFWATRESGEYSLFSPALPMDIIAGVSIVVSLALFAYTRRSRRDPGFILDLGLVYMVYVGLALGLMVHLGPVPANWTVEPEISWIVPNSPAKVLVASLIAVSMNPIAMLIARAQREVDLGPASNALLMHYPDYILVGVAVVISGVVTHLGRQVTRAREMGSYQLGELLGRGGMGEVYKATHRMLARPAVIKLIRPEMLGGADEESAQLAVKRFSREAEAAASLRSPHTVEVYDFGVTDDETLYLVMELLDGMDLETMVREHGALPSSRVIYILLQVCESLEEAHVRGLVHRDIKPANIHVGRVGLRHDFVKVLDFGLVKPAAKASGDGDSLATAAGLTPGTPAYMAPEVALGEAVDGRADIYALGCVAYFLLTGRLVFEADSLLQMIVKHLESEPVPPSRRAEHHVPAALDEVVLACLAKEPRNRMPSAARLARSLVEIDVEPWGEEQAARWWGGLAAPRLAAAGAER